MTGDTQQPGEKLWEVREVTGYGYNYRQHGHSRFIYAVSRRDAKILFVREGYKQFESSRLTATPVSEEAV